MAFNVTLAKGFLAELLEDWETGIEDGTYQEIKPERLEQLRALVHAPSATIPKAKRTYMICESCSSDDVRKDAWAEWDPKRGDWALGETFDACHCANCDGEANVVQVDAEAFASLKELADDERSEANGLAMMEGRLEDIQPY